MIIVELEGKLSDIKKENIHTTTKYYVFLQYDPAKDKEDHWN